MTRNVFTEATTPRRLFALTSVLLLGGCASFPRPTVSTLRQSTSDLIASPPTAAASVNRSPDSGAATVTRLPGAEPPSRRSSAPEASPAEIAQLFPLTPIDATLPPQPLPQFLNTVFGDLLHAPYVLGPGVGARSEIITVRSAPQMSQRGFVRLIQTALRDYGLSLSIVGGAVQVNESGAQVGDQALVLRSRSTAETAETSRTVVQFVQLVAVQAEAMQPLVQDLSPAARSVRLTVDVADNAIVVQGPGRDVAAAVSAITQLDQPRLAGAEVARLAPTFWRADPFANALTQALSAEGFIVSNTPVQPRGVMVLPLSATNQVLAFAADGQVMARIQFWAHELDQPSAIGEQKSTFVYSVRNTDAQALGALARGQTPQTYAPVPPVGVGAPTQLGQPGTPPAGPSQTPISTPLAPAFGFGQDSGGGGSGALPGGGSIVVDTIGNRVIFTGSATQFAQLHDLLQQLDVPPRQVMIEVTVAEVTLTDATNLGLEWFFNNSQSGQTLSGGTLGGLSLPTATGVTLSYSNLTLPGISNLQATFNAFASNNNVNILSRPRIVAKSGGDAQIQVGTDIPIIASQGAANVQTAGSTEVLQTVEYRQTGVILKVKPTVYGDNRVDLEISQEVSNQVGPSNGPIASPTIQDRTISTELSLEDGATAVLGGLISNTYSKGNNGVPFLKDVPILGRVFRSDALTGDKDELVVLVTPHILHDANEMSAVASGLALEVNRAFRVGTGWSYTLSPFATGVNLGPGPSPTLKSPDMDRALAAVRAKKATSPPAVPSTSTTEAPPAPATIPSRQPSARPATPAGRG